jgi:hypothetical protein
MYGVDAQAPGAQEYYDSLAALYASWGVEYVKADDMLLPYAEGEIELLSSALKRCGRDITLSLSCGPTDPEHAEHLRTHADLWRVSGDFWDDWSHLYAMFEHCARWAPHGGHGHWPDADMLPLGRIALRSHEHGLGERWTRFTRDEQRTMLSLWCIVGSPLLLGTHLPSLDDWTLGLLTNRDVLDVSRQAREPRQLYRRGDTVAWWARNSGGGCYLAVFNTGVSARAIATALPTDVGGSSLVRDLWTRTDLGPVIGTLTTDVPGHGVRLFSLTPEG